MARYCPNRHLHRVYCHLFFDAGIAADNGIPTGRQALPNPALDWKKQQADPNTYGAANCNPADPAHDSCFADTFHLCSAIESKDQRTLAACDAQCLAAKHWCIFGVYFTVLYRLLFRCIFHEQGRCQRGGHPLIALLRFLSAVTQERKGYCKRLTNII